jgi:opacity protein-like surface antigen
MTFRRTVSWVAGALLALPLYAHAQAASQQVGAIEIQPFVSSGWGSGAGTGAAVRWPIAEKFSLLGDVEFRHDDGNLLTFEGDNLYATLNLVFDLPSAGRFTPYVLGGGGLEHYRLRLDSAPAEIAPRTGRSFVTNAGGGVRMAINDRWGIRTEVRWTDGWADGAPQSLHIYYGATIGVGGKR